MEFGAREDDLALSQDPDVARLERWFERTWKNTHQHRCSWFVAICFVAGQQYVYYNSASNDFERVVEDGGKVRLIINQILPYLEDRITQFAHARAELQVIPESGPERAREMNREAARNSEYLLRFLERKLALKLKDQEFSWWLHVCTTAVQKIFWDADAGRRMKDAVEEKVEEPVRDPATGMALPGEYQMVDRQARDKAGNLLWHEFAEGEVAVENVSRFRFVIDPGAPSIRRAERVCELRPLTRLEAEEFLGDEAGLLDEIPAKDTSYDDLSFWERRIQSIMAPSLRFRIYGPDDKEGQYLLKEYWEAPSRRHPKGLHLLVLNGRRVKAPGTLPTTRDGDLLYPEQVFPYLSMQESLFPLGFDGLSTIDQAIQLQKLLNRDRSRMAEWVSRFVGRWVCDVSAKDDEEAFDDTDGTIYWDSHNGQVPPPTIATPPAMPQSYVECVRETKSDIEDVTGRHDISQGKRVPGVGSGRMAAFLAEKDTTRLGGKFDRWGQYCVERGAMILRCARENYLEPRSVEVTTDRHGRFDPRTLTVLGPEILDNLEIVPGTQIPRSRDFLEQRARQDWKDGVFGPPDSLAARVAYLKESGGGRVNELFRAEFLAEKKASDENRRLARGEPIPVKPWEMHAIEFETHREFAMGEEARDLSPEAWAALETHMMGHLAALNGPPPGAPVPPVAAPGAVPPGPPPAPPGPPAPMPGMTGEELGPDGSMMPEPSSALELADQTAAMANV